MSNSNKYCVEKVEFLIFLGFTFIKNDKNVTFLTNKKSLFNEINMLFPVCKLCKFRYAVSHY